MRKRIALGVMAMAIGIVTARADVPAIPVVGGQIQGAQKDGLRVFKGIPFAAPPVGALRWREPQPVVPWEGVRDCSEFGPKCPQAPYPEGSFYARELGETSEDCL